MDSRKFSSNMTVLVESRWTPSGVHQNHLDYPESTWSMWSKVKYCQKGRRIPTSVLVTALGINRKTLQAWIQESDINFRYDEIADEELDALVHKCYQENPSSGRAYIIGCLRAAHALRIQRHCVMASMKR